MFQHFYLLVVEQDVSVVKRVGVKLLGYHIFPRLQLVYVVTKQAIGSLDNYLSMAKVEYAATGGGNDVSVDRHGRCIHRMEDLAKFFTQLLSLEWNKKQYIYPHPIAIPNTTPTTDAQCTKPS
jgi:hypothetical protein